MILVNDLLNSEHNYTQLTSEKKEYNGFIRFQDHTTPELPLQSYTYIKRNLSHDEVKKIIDSEFERAKKENKEFIRFVFNPLDPFSGEIPELSSYDYHCQQLLIKDINDFEPVDNINCSFVQSSDRKKLNQLVIKLNRSLSKKVLKKHSTRWTNLRIDNNNLQTLVYKDKNEFLGSCDITCYKNIAKLEDFEVLERHRKKGIGDSLLSAAISKSMEMGMEKVYLIADRNDWVSDYYQRRGFEVFLEFHSYTLFI